MKKKVKTSILLLFLFFAGCGKDENLITKPEKLLPLDALYRSAFNEFEQGNGQAAIELFKKVEVRYSFSEWAPKATLMIMYIYYETGQYYEALEYAKKYKELYRVSKNIDYVNFITGLVFYEQIDIVARDQTYALAALKEFKKIIKNNPNSVYSEEIKFKIDLINEQIAGKHLYIARFYMKKSKWIPAIKRLKIVINEYDYTIYAQEALHRLVEIYYRLGNIKEAKKYAAILGYNFNDSNWYKKTYKIVANKNYVIENVKAKRKLKDRINKIFKFSK